MSRSDKQEARGKRPRRTRSSWVVLAMVGLLVGGMAVGVFLVPLSPPSVLEPVSSPTSVAVVTQSFVDPVKVEAFFVLGDATPLIVRTSGTVTTPIGGSGVLVSGKVALAVDERPVIGLNTAVPLYRDLEIGDRGGDVEALNAELTRLGYGDLSSDRFTWWTLRAWSALLGDAGVADSVWEFSLADAIWLPERTVTLESWSALPGTAVTYGEAIAYVRPKLLGVELTLSGQQTPAEGSRELTLFGLSLPLDNLALPLSKEFLRDLEVTTDFANMLLNEQRSRQGTWSLVDPITALRVPPGALFAVTGARGCIQSGGVGLPVTIVGAGLGATLVVVDQVVNEVAIGAGITATGC